MNTSRGRGDEHNQSGNKAEGAHADDEGLVKMTHDRMRVHTLLAGFEPAVKAAGLTFFDFIFNGFRGGPSKRAVGEFHRAAVVRE